MPTSPRLRLPCNVCTTCRSSSIWSVSAKCRKLVRRAGKYELEGWKPLIGDNLFLRESGAVASQFHIPGSDRALRGRLVGAKRGIVLGKKSGLDSIRLKAEELGLDVPEVQRAAVLEAVKRKAIANGGLVSDDEFRAILQNLADKDALS